MRSVSTVHSLLSPLHKMGEHMAFSFSEFSDKPNYASILVRAFTALAHAQNGCVYGIFYLSMLRQDLVCVQSRQSSHCSSPLHKMGVHMAYSFSECSDASEHGRCLIRAFAARTLTNVCRQIIRLKLKSLNPLGSCL